MALSLSTIDGNSPSEASFSSSCAYRRATSASAFFFGSTAGALVVDVSSRKTRGRPMPSEARPITVEKAGDFGAGLLTVRAPGSPASGRPEVSEAVENRVDPLDRVLVGHRRAQAPVRVRLGLRRALDVADAGTRNGLDQVPEFVETPRGGGRELLDRAL